MLKTEEGTGFGHGFERRRRLEEKRGLENGWPEPPMCLLKQGDGRRLGSQRKSRALLWPGARWRLGTREGSAESTAGCKSLAFSGEVRDSYRF